VNVGALMHHPSPETVTFLLTNPPQSSTTVTNSSRPGSNPAPKPSDVGTIKISIHRVRRGEATSAWIPGKLNMHRHVPEYYAQGVVT
jgi:hypothetical protein